MPPVALALMTAPFSAIAAVTIFQSLFGGQMAVDDWSPLHQPRTLGFGASLIFRALVVAFGVVEGLHAFGLAGDPLLFVQALLMRFISA